MLKKQCVVQHQLKGLLLVEQAEASLVEFEKAVTHIEGVRALYALNDCVLELSIFADVWDELSTLLFEQTLMASNALNKKTRQVIRELFVKTRAAYLSTNEHAAPVVSQETCFAVSG